MKAIKSFSYHLDGNNPTLIAEGETIPDIAQPYAVKNGYAEKAKQPPLNKAKQAPRNRQK
jgi:hypothetical protein